jgi:hypothetical protein
MEIEGGSTKSRFLGTRFGIDYGPVVRLRESEPSRNITEVTFMCDPSEFEIRLNNV